MTTKGNGKRKRIDWPLIERWVVTTPHVTLADAADRFDVHLKSVMNHGSSSAGRWIDKQIAYFVSIARDGATRMEEILAQGKADDVTAMKAIELRLQKVALSMLEKLFPPSDAPVEVLIAARDRLEGLTGKEMISAVTDIARTLTETGRHRRLLTGKATSIFARADSPDAYVPDSPELARALELQSRMAQKALKAAAEGLPIDIEGAVLPPVSLASPVPVGVPPVPLGEGESVRTLAEGGPDVGL